MSDLRSAPGSVRPTPWRRDPAELAAGLRAWARSEISPTAEVVGVVAPDNGMSSETVLFDVRVGDAVEHLVARLAPPPSAVSVFEHYDMALQAGLMELVGERTPVPVPPVRGLVLDDSIPGAPFLVMERVAGRAPSDNPPRTCSGGGWSTWTRPRGPRCSGTPSPCSPRSTS